MELRSDLARSFIIDESTGLSLIYRVEQNMSAKLQEKRENSARAARRSCDARFTRSA